MTRMIHGDDDDDGGGGGDAYHHHHVVKNETCHYKAIISSRPRRYKSLSV